MDSNNDSPALTDAEWLVMQAVWDGRGPVSVRDVLERVEPRTGWAYSTVKTMLSRLVDKGALSVESRGKTNWFSARLSPDRARRSALHGLVDRAFGGVFGSLVQYLVDDAPLSERDRRRLEELVADELSSRKPEVE